MNHLLPYAISSNNIGSVVLVRINLHSTRFFTLSMIHTQPVFILLLITSNYFFGFPLSLLPCISIYNTTLIASKSSLLITLLKHLGLFTLIVSTNWNHVCSTPYMFIPHFISSSYSIYPPIYSHFCYIHILLYFFVHCPTFCTVQWLLILLLFYRIYLSVYWNHEWIDLAGYREIFWGPVCVRAAIATAVAVAFNYTINTHV